MVFRWKILLENLTGKSKKVVFHGTKFREWGAFASVPLLVADSSLHIDPVYDRKCLGHRIYRIHRI